VGTLRTTCVPTLLRGGHAENALPQSATVTVNCRIFPGVMPESVQATLQRLVGRRLRSSCRSRASTASLHRSGLMFWPRSRGSSTACIGHSARPAAGFCRHRRAIFRAAGIPTYGTSESFIRESDDFRHGLDEREPVQSFYDGLDSGIGSSRTSARRRWPLPAESLAGLFTRVQLLDDLKRLLDIHIRSYATDRGEHLTGR